MVSSAVHQAGENAVAPITTDHSFLGKHRDKISGVLSCFDRLIVIGHLPLSYALGLEGFLYQQKVLLKDFKSYAPQVAERVKEHIKGLVEAAGAPYRYLPKKIEMEKEARRLAQAKGIREGIVCGFSKMETCGTYRFHYSGGRPRLRKDYRRCLVLYVFVMHAVLGLIHVKLQTWFPLTMQIYVNGHDFVANKLDDLGVAYQMYDNAFLTIDNVAAAQACAERMEKQNWPKLLGELARQFNPLLGKELQGQEYYWVVNQAEYATDVMFRSEAALASLYPRLVEHARACLSAEDVLKFMGRKLTANFEGEVRSHVGRRPEGVRVRHTMKSNCLKMYDKGARLLRIETTINDPKEFRVRRWRTRKDGSRELAWQPLCKGVAWLWRYAELSRASNGRYLQAMTVVDDDGAARKLIDRVTRPAQLHGKTKRALQPLSPADQALFLAVLRGEHRLRGFRNRDLAHRLYPKPTKDPAERRRRCGRVTRLIQLLRAHKLVAKLPHTRRYKITAQGETLMSAAIYVRYKHLPNELTDAA
jgi:hypothetical protein